MLSTSAFGRPCEVSKGGKGWQHVQACLLTQVLQLIDTKVSPQLAWLRLMSFEAEFSLHCRACWVLQGREHSPNLLALIMVSFTNSQYGVMTVCFPKLACSVAHAGCRRQLEQCEAGCEVEVAVNTGCVLFKEGDYEGAAAKFKEAAALDSGNPVRRCSRQLHCPTPLCTVACHS